ncbi:branched-chain alpha-ketoacid dehydrogenase [Melampsora americana]|nr:branched-chain alpha-ketoacid dehydrogenase [Melampsora americana]
MDSIPFSLRQLIFFGKMLESNQIETDLEHQKRLVRGANFIRVQLPIRLARRIRDFQSLPYIVASNPHLTDALQLYVDAFDKMRSYPPITDQQDNQRWCEFLEDLLNQHRIVIPQLAIGIAESANHLTSHQIDTFMTRMLQSRISRRVLAQHHIALTNQYQLNQSSTSRSDRKSKGFIGVVNTELKVLDVVEKCIKLVQAKLGLGSNLSNSDRSSLDVRITGEQNVGFAYIPDQLEYIIFELLLNTFRATIKQARKRSITPSALPIQIHIVSSPTDISIRISDQAGGIKPSFSSLSNLISDESDDFPPSINRRELFSFSHLVEGDKNQDRLKRLIKTGGLAGTVGEQISRKKEGEDEVIEDEEMEVQDARLRIGLPLSFIFAEFFGGSLDMYSIEGSADAVLRIPKLGTTTEPNMKQI